MLFALIGIAALIAALTVGGRKLLARRRELRRPGRSPAHAIPIHDFGDMDAHVRVQRCSCGGRFNFCGEGASAHGTRPLRFARLECTDCERERRVYFDLSTIRH